MTSNNFLIVNKRRRRGEKGINSDIREQDIIENTHVQMKILILDVWTGKRRSNETQSIFSQKNISTQREMKVTIDTNS